MKYALLLIQFLCVACLGSAQTETHENRIVVLADAKIEVPATRVNISLQLASSDSTSLENAHAQQGELEAKLMRIFRDFNIPQKYIRFTLLTVSKSIDAPDATPTYHCLQQAGFVLTNLHQLTALQERLIKDGFTDFFSEFTAGNTEQKKKEVFKKAIQVARSKASILAAASGRKLGKIVKIMETDEIDPSFRNFTLNAESDQLAEEPALINIPQTVHLSARLKVVFEMLDSDK